MRVRSGSSASAARSWRSASCAQNSACRVGIGREIGQGVFERLVFGQLLRRGLALRTAEVRADHVPRDLIDPRRELPELRVERPQVGVRAQERLLREIGDVGSVAQARPDEVRNSPLVALDQHPEKLPFPLAHA